MSILAIIPAFFSCSNAAKEIIADNESPTLRYVAENLYEATVWTEEVEKDRLYSDVSAVHGVSSRLVLSPVVVVAEKVSDSDRIFPSIDGFGSLDTTLITPALRDMLSSFSDAVSKNKDADSFMLKECVYSLALFYNDFERIFGRCFELDDHVKADSETKSETSDEEKTETVYFDSFVFGQPFIDGVCYEVPVKFFSKKANMTLCVFCVEKSRSWKIDQIQIADWEIF